MSCYELVLETMYMHMPKNRAQVSQELGGWRGIRTRKVQRGPCEPCQLQREFKAGLKAIALART